ncbi:MAG: hypothetical protein IKT58_01120, partial [Oscillospiraceae bacterium]|nr:hypothetical protein [Oscillospiraceae bacterium]
MKTRLDEMGYIFTDSELLGIAFHYAPSFAERLRLMGLLAEQCPTVSDHARKCIRWQEVCLERFKAHGENEIYELHIKDTPDAYEERYLCRSYEAALEMIDGFYKEYAFTPDPRASYTVEKRKILDVGQAFEEDALGGCTLRTGKVLVSVDRFPEETEHGPCPE